MYLKLGQRLSGIAPFQDFMAHGRLQAAITIVDIVLPRSLFIFSFFVTDKKKKNEKIPSYYFLIYGFILDNFDQQFT